MIEVNVSGEFGDLGLNALYAATDPAIIVRLAGKTVERELRAHFIRRNAQPNKRGWPSRGLWRDIANQTATGAVSGAGLAAEVRIAVSHPAINLKVYGGRVTPKRGKFLALPATAAAYAAGSPREGATPELRPATAFNAAIGKPMRALVDARSPRPKKGALADTGAVWYWLARQTTHAPDKDALPADYYVDAKVSDTIEGYLRRQLRGAA